MDTASQWTSSTPRRGFRRLAVACFIATGHVAIVLMVMRSSVQVPARVDTVQPIAAEIAAPQPPSFLSMSPDLAPAAIAVKLVMPDLTVELEDSESSLQPPMIDPEMQLDVSSYTERAGLPAGVVATVILLLEIAPDGSVMSAEVTRSNAAEQANAAAVDYAKATQWMPGRVDGQPQAMQASLTVILGE